MKKFFIDGSTDICYAKFLNIKDDEWYEVSLWFPEQKEFSLRPVAAYAPEIFNTFQQAQDYVVKTFEDSVNELSKCVDISVARTGKQAYDLSNGELDLVQIQELFPYDLVRAQRYSVKTKAFGPAYTINSRNFRSTVNQVREILLQDLAKQRLKYLEL